MFERLKSKTAVATTASLIAALGVGGVAVAQNSGNATPAQKANPVAKVQAQSSKAQESTSGPDTDNVQSGDQSAPDQGGAQEPAGTETNDSGAQEQAGTETNDGSGEQPGSEVSNNDGPGGHADEPGNANADHQAQGQE
jgi:hypothetical protein